MKKHRNGSASGSIYCQGWNTRIQNTGEAEEIFTNIQNVKTHGQTILGNGSDI